LSAARGSFPPTLKRLGQHFLTDERVVQRIADALEIVAGETVVEIGPGRGVLTDQLIDRIGSRPGAGRLVAIELDRALAGMLRMRYADRPNVQIVEHDVLEVKLGDVAGGEYVLAGNVPYYITTPILFHVLEAPSPRRAIFLVQREVAERAVSPPGGKTYGALSVNLQAVAKVEYLFDVPPGAFTPPPKVDSAVIRMTPLPESLVTEAERKHFQRFTQSLFGLRRKQMTRVLRTVLNAEAEIVEPLLSTVGIDPTARPETVSPQTLARLFRAVRQREG
jgi:16S rRNA (adenine1518-N6/adenine1519-N6)-dimethyltransferase